MSKDYFKHKKIDFKYNLKEYWRTLRKQKWAFFVLIFVALIAEALFVVDSFLFKFIIDKGTLFINEDITRDAFIGTLVIIAAVFIGIVVFRSFMKGLVVNLNIKFIANLLANIKRRYFNHIIKLSHNFHASHKTGSMISRMNRGAGAAEQMMDIVVFQFAPLVAGLLTVALSLAYFNIASAITISVITLVFILYSLYIQQIQQKPKLDFNSQQDKEKGFIADIFINIDSIKFFGKENLIGNIFRKITNETKKKSLKYWGYYIWWDFGHVLIIGIGAFFLIYFPLMSFLAGEITLGTLVFAYTIYGNVVGPMFGFVWGMRGFYRSMADFQDLFYYKKIENDIKDKPKAEKMNIPQGKIEFKDVDFNYGKRKHGVFSLNKFNLTIKPNEKIAFVGHSGCGKTTLVKLIYRLYDVKEGSIKIDGKDLRDVNQESLRESLSIVPQEAILFDDTIYNNIKFSNPKASRSEVWNAIKFAQLDSFVNNLPKKLNTIVGERGVKLSGGEKQRVSIARAVLANKKILVLDEATSALDSETEHEIQKDLFRLLQGRTSIIIAHRLSTIMNADRIIVMKKGKIIEQGSHNTLIRKNGEYKKLWKLQKGGYIK